MTFEEWYGTWAKSKKNCTITIRDLGQDAWDIQQQKIDELQSKLDRAVEGLRFYCSLNRYECETPEVGTKIFNILPEDDWEKRNRDYTVDGLEYSENIYIAGKKAREILKEIE